MKTTAPRSGSDAAPQDLATGTPTALAEDLRQLVAAERVLTRPIDLIRYASDASLYRLIPKVVVLAADATEVAALFAYSRAQRVPMTFRSAGTSLSGQSQTDGILVEVRRHFDSFQVLEGGAAVAAGPGVIAGKVNAALARHGRKLGPDPASVNAATIGGIVANNSSGMCCGITHNAYQTMRSVEFVLPSGTRIDTAEPDAEAIFAASEPALAATLAQLRGQLLDDPELTAKLRRKYAVKNTTGYGLNALLDHDTPPRDLQPSPGRVRGDSRVHRQGRARDRPRSASSGHCAGDVPDDPGRLRGRCRVPGGGSGCGGTARPRLPAGGGRSPGRAGWAGRPARRDHRPARRDAVAVGCGPHRRDGGGAGRDCGHAGNG